MIFHFTTHEQWRTRGSVQVAAGEPSRGLRSAKEAGKKDVETVHALLLQRRRACLSRVSVKVLQNRRQGARDDRAVATPKVAHAGGPMTTPKMAHVAGLATRFVHGRIVPTPGSSAALYSWSEDKGPAGRAANE